MTKKFRLISLIALVTVFICSLCALVGCNNVSSVSIANKEELQAEWHINDYDREVKLEVNGEETKNVNAEIVSSNEAAVEVSGKRLRPVGAGTATVTVSYGGKTDSVDVKVTARLKDFEISNKNELTEYWTTGNPDRTVQICVAPTLYNPQDVDFTLETSNADIVFVSGKTISAKGVGTAVITAKFADFTDEVEIKVQPAIDSVSISNKTALGADWAVGESRTLEMSFAPAEFTESNTKIKVTANEPDAIKYDGYTVTPAKIGDYTLTVSVGDKSDTVDVKFVIVAPTINIANGRNEINQYFGKTVFLPNVTATACDGKDLTAYIEKTLSSPEDMDLSGVKLNVAKTGKHTVTYTVTDPRDTTKTTTEVINVNVARNIISKDNDGGVLADISYVNGSEYVNDEDQKINIKHTGFTWAKFDITPSKLYYAEVTYDYSKQTNVSSDFLYGMSHCLQGTDNKRWVAMAVDAGTENDQNNFWLRDFESESYRGGGWGIVHANYENTPSFYQYSISQYKEIPFDKTNKKFTIQTARDGDTFYAFINGYYIGSVSYEYYRDKNTIPGIFGSNFKKDDIAGVEATGIKFYDGEEARATIEKLLYDNENNYGLVTPYVYWRGEGTFYGARNNKVSVSKTEADGINFDYNYNNLTFENSSLSPNLYIEKEITFEWEYKMTEATSDNSRMILTARTRKHDDAILGFGVEFNKTAGTAKFIYTDRPTTDGVLQDTSYTYTTALENVDASGGMKFKLVIKQEATCAKYTIVMQSKKNPAQSFTKTFEVNYVGQRDAKYSYGVLLNWNNEKVAGKYSHINWSYEAEEVNV